MREHRAGDIPETVQFHAESRLFAADGGEDGAGSGKENPADSQTGSGSRALRFLPTAASKAGVCRQAEESAGLIPAKTGAAWETSVSSNDERIGCPLC